MRFCVSEGCVGTRKRCLLVSSEVDLVNDKFPLKVCVWSGYGCIFYVLWIKGKSEIKLNLTRYNTLFTLTYFWLYINWNANTLIHMYRDCGHGQPRFSSESSLESVVEKLKTFVGDQVQTNPEKATQLNPQPDPPHLCSKNHWIISQWKLKWTMDHTLLGWGIFFIPVNATSRTRVTHALCETIKRVSISRILIYCPLRAKVEQFQYVWEVFLLFYLLWLTKAGWLSARLLISYWTCKIYILCMWKYFSIAL